MSTIAALTVSLELGVPVAQGYQFFVHEFARWWPVLSHSLSRHANTRCHLDPVSGGAISETAPDGTVHLWGEVQALEPGRRIRFSWFPGRDDSTAQWVEVSFEASADDGCKLTLTHGGWEVLGEIAPILRQQYGPGWEQVLQDSFARALIAAAPSQ